MRIISEKHLTEFYRKHPDAEQPVKSWRSITRNADWQNAHDIKKDLNSADQVGDGRIVFNLKGNSYRLVVRINFNKGIVYIRFIGTHAEYDKIDVKTI
jgi:mRNA interferase HigB